MHQGKHNLALSVNIGVEETENVLVKENREGRVRQLFYNLRWVVYGAATHLELDMGFGSYQGHGWRVGG